MTWEEWLSADGRRTPATAHVGYGAAWRGEDGDRHLLRWVPATGEVVAIGGDGRAVEVLGVLPDRDRVDAALGGWADAEHREGSLYVARTAVAETADTVAMGDPPPGPAARVGLELADGSRWAAGWDEGLATFFAQEVAAPPDDDPIRPGRWLGTGRQQLGDLHALEEALGEPLDDAARARLAGQRGPVADSPAPAEPPAGHAGYGAWLAADHGRGHPPPVDLGSDWWEEDPEERSSLAWSPGTGELHAVDRLGRVEVLGRFEDRPTVDEVLADRSTFAGQAGGLYWVRETAARALEPGAPTGYGFSARQLRGWAEELSDGWADLQGRTEDLDRRERRLNAERRALHAGRGAEDRWALPAGPVAQILASVAAGTGDDLATVARGLDLEPVWARSVLAGELDEVDVPTVQRLCEALHCSPYDLWGDEDAATVLHAYPPGLWPATIEPLFEPDGPDLAPDDPDLPDGPDLGP